MAQRAKAGIHGSKSKAGRVTPSKLRRTAIIAVDGVLAVGTGAVAGLFATSGVASGTAPAPGWTPLQSPVPSGPNAPAGNPHENIATEACASAVSCASAGSYSDGTNTHGLLGALASGSWSSVEAPLPSNVATDPIPNFFDSACPSNGSCVVVGGYKTSAGSGTSAGLIETLSGGLWSDIEAPLPANASPAASQHAFLKSVACPAPGNCTAVGSYDTGVGVLGFVDTLSGGSWTATQAPTAPGGSGLAELGGVSCPAVGTCYATGIYEVTGTGGTGIELLSESGGSWTAAAAALPGDARTGVNEFATVSPFQANNGVFDGIGQSLSCAGTVCNVSGSYETTAGGNAGLILHLSGSTWTATAAPLPGNTASGASVSVDLLTTSCGFNGGCVAVGDYIDTSGGTRPLVESISASGAVTGAEAPQPPDAATGASVTASLSSVSCLSSTDCTAVGSYRNGTSSNQVPLIDTLSGTTWSALAAPLPGNAGTGTNAQGQLFSVSCSNRGACLGGGNYHDTSGNELGLLNTYTPPQGYWLDAADGGVFAFPNATFLGSMGGMHLNQPIVGMATTPGDGGYWLVASDGGVFTFGNATFYGSTGNIRLNKPIVGMAATPDGRGYWLVASDGGIFTYGDAGFYGSAGNIHLNKPVVGMAPTASGLGYWLVATDGGIFSYGDAVFYGSTGGLTLNKPVVGMAANVTGNGYWLVASDGGIFSYGDALFHGSSGAIHLNKPVVGMMPTFDGGGYWLVATDGGIFSYGNTSFLGSTGNIALVSPVVGGAPS